MQAKQEKGLSIKDDGIFLFLNNPLPYVDNYPLAILAMGSFPTLCIANVFYEQPQSQNKVNM